MAAGTITPGAVQLLALNDQLEQATLWINAARTTLKMLQAKRMSAPEPGPAIFPGQGHQPTGGGDTLPPIPKNAGSALKPASYFEHPLQKASEQLAERRPKQVIRQEALILGVPETVIDGPQFLNGKKKPTDMGYVSAENLLLEVKRRQAAGQEFHSLWRNTPKTELQF